MAKTDSQEFTLVEAVNLALFSEMHRDENVVILGEDVGTNGGVFRATDGLKAEFGLRRVMDTPLAETLIAGLCVGMACQGLRPVAEIQFMGFMFAALEHILCHAARMRNRTRGRLSCPLVFRFPYGGGIHAPEHHSESLETMFVHTPGLRVVVPSSPQRAYGLLLAAMRDPDPVMFLEPTRIYRLNKQHVIDNGEALPLDVCYTLRPGDDITLISWGAMIVETLQAAKILANQGIQAEVIDVTTLKPLDIDTIVSSIKKTGRCIVIHEAAQTCGLGAEIASQITEKAFKDLQAPVKRVCGYDTIMPYFRNEHLYMPSANDIVNAAKETLHYS